MTNAVRDGEGPGPRAGRRRLRLVALALAVVALVAGGVLVAIVELGWGAEGGVEVSAAAVERLILSWGAWGVAASIVLMILHSFVPFPAEFVALANGMAYGALWGAVITWSGAMLGA